MPLRSRFTALTDALYLWEGEVVAPDKRGEDVEAIRSFNGRVLADNRVESAMLSVSDGLTLARKLPLRAARGGLSPVL